MNEQVILAKLDEIVETQRDLVTHFKALLVALGVERVEEPVDALAAGFQAFAEESRKRHARGRG